MAAAGPSCERLGLGAYDLNSLAQLAIKIPSSAPHALVRTKLISDLNAALDASRAEMASSC